MSRASARPAWIAVAIAAVLSTTLFSAAGAGSTPTTASVELAAQQQSAASPGDAIKASPPTWGRYAPRYGEMAFSRDGTLYVTDCMNARIYRVSSSGRTSVFAGSGPGGFTQWVKVKGLGWTPVASFGGDGRHPTDALFNCTYGITFDAAGNMLIADHGN